MKKNNLLKTVLLLVFSVFLLQSCREEANHIENMKYMSPHQDGVSKHVSIKQFNEETNISVQQIKNAFLSINKKTVASKVSLSDFDIDTTFIKKLIYQENKKSFSIRAYKKGEDPNTRIYNIIYHQENGSWQADIIQYTYTKDWLQRYNKNASIPFTGRIQHLGAEKNLSFRSTENYECSSRIDYLCYCADHTTSQCNGCNLGFRNVLTIECIKGDGSGGDGGTFGGTDINPPPGLGTPPYQDPSIGGGSLGDGAEFEPNLSSFDDPLYEKYALLIDLKNIVWSKLQNYPELYKKFENFHLQTNGDNLFNLSELANYASSDYQFTNFAIDFWSSNSSTSWQQIKKWFLDGYSTQYQSNLTKLSPSQLLDFVNINKEIDASPYEEEFVKETNEAFVTFAAYKDLESITKNDIETVLNNNCCVGLFYTSSKISEKTTLIVVNARVLKATHKDWPWAKCFWEASRETIQLLLDIGGMVPLIGEVCDITNGVIYTMNGDTVNAALSYAGAIPIAGWGATGAKLGIKVINKASDIPSRVVLKWVLGTDGKIYFGTSTITQARNQLRRVLKLTNSAIHAHHIIPVEVAQYAIVQKAAKSKEAFHINEAINGIPLPNTDHLTGHSLYNDKIKDVLNFLNKDNPNIEVSYQRLISFNNYLRNLIKNNPNLNLGQIANLIKYP